MISVGQSVPTYPWSHVSWGSRGAWLSLDQMEEEREIKLAKKKKMLVVRDVVETARSGEKV